MTMTTTDDVQVITMPPWHGLAKEVHATTAAEAVIAAGLDWEVELRAAGYQSSDKKSWRKVKNRFVTVRTDTDAWLGTVGSHYVPTQNKDAFSFLDYEVAKGRLEYRAAGALRGGAVVFLVARLNPSHVAVYEDDAVEMNVLVRTSHDGSKAISVYVLPINVQTGAVLALNLYGTSVRQRWSVQHVSTMGGRLSEANLDPAFEYASGFMKLGNKLAAVKLHDDDVPDLLDRIIPNRPRKPKTIASITGLYKADPLHTGTGWALINAIARYFDHERSTRSAEATFTATIEGQGAITRNRAAALVLTK